MEDAMILNKASFERGFAHGTVIKCEVSCLIYDFYLLWHHLQTESHCLNIFFCSQIVDLIKISGSKSNTSSLRFGEFFL